MDREELIEKMIGLAEEENYSFQEYVKKKNYSTSSALQSAVVQSIKLYQEKINNTDDESEKKSYQDKLQVYCDIIDEFGDVSSNLYFYGASDDERKDALGKICSVVLPQFEKDFAEELEKTEQEMKNASELKREQSLNRARQIEEALLGKEGLIKKAKRKKLVRVGTILLAALGLIGIAMVPIGLMVGPFAMMPIGAGVGGLSLGIVPFAFESNKDKASKQEKTKKSKVVDNEETEEEPALEDTPILTEEETALEVTSVSTEEETEEESE